VGAVALAGLRGVGQDLGLLSYEPRSLRPSPVWAQRRARTLERIAALVGPLLLVASSDGALGDKAGHRLAALADGLSRGHIEAPDLPASGAAEGPTQALWQWVEVPLVALEAAIAADMTTPPGEEHSPA
jgi:multidrug resistance protein MdtO